MTTSTEKPKELRLPDGRRIRTVRVRIHQPKLRDEPFEKVYTVEEILALAARFRSGAASVANAVKHHGVIAIADWNRTYLNPNPNEQDCAFCRAMAVCPNAAEKVRSTITPLGAIEDLDFVPAKKPNENPKVAQERREVVLGSGLVPNEIEELDAKMQACGFIEDWVLAIRARMEQLLLAGQEAEHYGLELGRKGARAFTDPEKAMHLLRKTYRLKEKDVFNFKMKTPTQLEELTKTTIDNETGEVIPPVLGEKRWARVCKLVNQKDPKPSVKFKEHIKTPYSMPKPTPLAAVPDEDEDSDLY
jgi:hypothetical protein